MRKGVMKRQILMLVCIAFGLVWIAGCSSGPSDDIVVSTVRQYLERQVPPGLARYLTGGSQAQIEEIRIVQRGKKTDDTWPVKIFAKGTCVVQFGGRRSFQGETEFVLYQDPYGNWKAEHRGVF
jgi:hypothetical protein